MVAYSRGRRAGIYLAISLDTFEGMRCGWTVRMVREWGEGTHARKFEAAVTAFGGCAFLLDVEVS